MWLLIYAIFFSMQLNELTAACMKVGTVRMGIWILKDISQQYSPIRAWWWIMSLKATFLLLPFYLSTMSVDHGIKLSFSTHPKGCSIDFQKSLRHCILAISDINKYNNPRLGNVSYRLYRIACIVSQYVSYHGLVYRYRPNIQYD